MRSGIVRSIVAVRLFVHFHILCPFLTVSEAVPECVCFLQCLQASIGHLFILCRRSFVGIMSCTTLYHGSRVVSSSGASLKFFHTVPQSTCGHLRATRITGMADPALRMVAIVLYIRVLYALSDSVLTCWGTYAASTSDHLRYPSAFGMRSLYGGFLLCVCILHLLIQSAAIVPVLCP